MNHKNRSSRLDINLQRKGSSELAAIPPPAHSEKQQADEPCDLVDQDAEAQVTAGDHKSASGMGHGYDR